jgi:hypothetical protein
MAGSCAVRLSPQPLAEACGSRSITATGAGLGGLDREVQRQRGLTDTALLGDDVERFFAWIGRNRRLAKDFEATID